MIGLGLSIGRRRVRSAGGAPEPDPHCTARYWRMSMPVPNPVSPQEYLSVGRVWMYRKGSQLSYDGAVASESSMYNGRSAALTFRNTPLVSPEAFADVWTSSIANPVNEWIEVDFGTAREIDSIVIVPMMYRNGLRNPQTFAFQYSMDRQSWTTVFSVSGQNWSDGESKRFGVQPART